jgi:phosphohistidine phosphatase
VGETARQLVLLRHAKSEWPDVADHERPLAERGRRDAPAVGRWLRTADITPDLVVCSSARRARETWKLASPELRAKVPTRYEQRVYDASPGELIVLVNETPEDVRTLLVIGHNPTVQQLAVSLAGDAEGDALKQVQTDFGTAALAVLEVPGAWSELEIGGAKLVRFAKPRG